MPYWFETHRIKIPRELRRNTKLSEEYKKLLFGLKSNQKFPVGRE